MARTTKRSLALAALAAVLTLPSIAQAQASPLTLRARYSIPWNLRPAIAVNIVRVDHALAVIGTTSPTARGPSAINTATILTFGGKPISALPDLGFYGRLGVVTNDIEHTEARAAFVNPALFALWTPQLAAGLRLPVFLGATVPVGPGSDSSPAQRGAFGSGIYTRQAMDNIMFAGNYFAVAGGAGIAWMGHGLSAQAEFTLAQLTRVWGESVDVDTSRTAFTSGVHVGYQVIPWLTLSLEAHYQHWLSTPKVVANNELFRSQFTVGGGIRGNFLLGTTLVRPGIAFFMPVGGPMNAMEYKIVQFDLAVPL